jgi:hypothetical protein
LSLLAASLLQCHRDITERELKRQLDAAPRRTDRLTLLSLLAVQPIRQQLQSDCGLYVASVNPDEKNMQELLESVCIQQMAPKPFQFVNSVSNAAGFHLAKALQLQGPNLFISAGAQVWDNLLRLAGLDLRLGLSQALLIHCNNGHNARVEVLLLDSPLHVPPQTDFDQLKALAACIEDHRIEPAR